MIKVFGRIFGLLSFCSVAFGLYSAAESYLFVRSAKDAQGRVVEVETNTLLQVYVPDESDIGKPYTGSFREESRYRARIKYTHPETRTEAVTIRALERKYEVGDTVPILVTSKEVRINSFNGIWGLAVLGIIMGGSLGGLWSLCVESTSDSKVRNSDDSS